MRQGSLTMMEKSQVLNSWKEIAAYLGRGVRTVQRWERDLRLPVHRPKGKDRSAVLAFPAELDQWLLKTPVRYGDHLFTPAPLEETGNPFRQASELRAQIRQLREDVYKKAECQRVQTLKLSTTLRDVLRRVRPGQSTNSTEKRSA